MIIFHIHFYNLHSKEYITPDAIIDNGNIIQYEDSYIKDIEIIDNNIDEILVCIHQNQFKDTFNMNCQSHNPIGPAYIEHYEDGSVKHKAFFIKDKRLTKEEFNLIKGKK